MNTGRQQQLIEKFREVTAERLAKLNNGLVRLENHPDDEEAAAQAAREIHTLKSEAMLLGFSAIGRIAHTLEELMLRAREEGFSPASPLGELIPWGFDAIDRLRKLSRDAEEGKPLADGFEERVRRHFADEPTPAATASAPTSAASTPQLVHRTPRRDTERDRGRDGSSIRVDLRRLDLLADLSDELLLGESITRQSIESMGRLDDGLAQIDRDLSHALTAHRRDDEALRTAVAGALRQQELLRRELRDLLRRTREDLTNERSKLENLETHVRDLRLLPVETLFQVYPRAVRDLARQLGKRVRLEVSGVDVEVDKQVLDRIEEPLLHLIRNSVDHGIEPPAQRAAAGKPETAVIQLSATQRGHQVVIQVVDDGCGIEVERLRRLAVQRGIITADKAASLDDDESLRLVFVAGLSTKEAVSEVAGRGVGLDVVRREIEGLGGTVTLSSRVGAGSRFGLRVPVSLVRAPVLIFRIGESLYGLSSSAADAVVQVDRKDIQRVGNGAAFRLQDRLVPLVELAPLLGLSHDNGASRTPVIVLTHGERQLGCTVDEVLHERHVIQRELTPFAASCRLASGTAIGADGRLVVLLSPAEIADWSRDSLPRSDSRSEARRPRRRCVLVADDSELTRDMLVNLVSHLGHEVLEAVDGRDALQRIATRSVDLVITDLEMPVLDGFELLSELRASPRLKNVPVVVCTTRGSEEDRRRASHLGADAYLVKAQFSDSDLLELVDRLLPE
jgi:chemotaxis protein histidine kinase CheA